MTTFVRQASPKDSKEQSGTTPEVPEKKKEYQRPGFRKMTIDEAREMLKKKGIDLDELIRPKQS
jgi:hypothetical protein